MPDGKRYCVYHARMAENPDERVVLIDEMEIDEDGKLHVKGPSTGKYWLGGSETESETWTE
jgi:hypothetical protein